MLVGRVKETLITKIQTNTGYSQHNLRGERGAVCPGGACTTTICWSAGPFHNKVLRKGPAHYRNVIRRCTVERSQLRVCECQRNCLGFEKIGDIKTAKAARFLR